MINWTIFVFPIVLFIVFFVIHVFWWRLFHPRSHISALILCFILLPAIVLFICILIGGDWGITALVRPKLAYAVFFYYCIAGAYIQTYPAIQAWSPSLYIVYIIRNSGKTLSCAEIAEQISAESLIHERIQDLLDEGLLRSDSNGNVRLTAKGNALALFFIKFRQLLGLGEGGG